MKKLGNTYPLDKEAARVLRNALKTSANLIKTLQPIIDSPDHRAEARTMKKDLEKQIKTYTKMLKSKTVNLKWLAGK